jgi:hypothetical protein
MYGDVFKQPTVFLDNVTLTTLVRVLTKEEFDETVKQYLNRMTCKHQPI